MDNRTYQNRAIRFLFNTKRGILESPAGSGKTHIAASALAQCIEKRKGKAAIEIMVHTCEQVDQMKVACARFPIIARNADLSIFCAASAPLGTSPDLLIIDECHRSASTSWSRKIKQAPSAIWGLSATPFGTDEYRNDKMIELFGTRIHRIQREGLVDAGHLAHARVTWHTISDPNVTVRIGILEQQLLEQAKREKPYLFRGSEIAVDRQVKRIQWRAVMQEGLYDNEPRNAIIVREANSRIQDGNHVIVLIGKVDHGELLAAQIDGAVLCNSKMGKRKRREAIAGFRNGEIACLVATSLLEEGFDAPIADCLIVASGGKSERKAVQSTGRVLRPYDGKAHGVIVDFQDDFHPMISWHSEERFNTYAELNYQQSDAQ